MNNNDHNTPPSGVGGLEVYKIGKLGKPHGIKGEISFMFTDDIFDQVDADYLVLCIDDIMVPFFMEEYRFRSDESALVKFEDIDTQERAAELTGTEVFFPRELAEEADNDDLSFAQIVGFTIFDERRHVNIGTIGSVDTSTDNTLFELEDGTLIPVADEWIKDIDNKNKTIIMALPEGLIDLNE